MLPAAMMNRETTSTFSIGASLDRRELDRGPEPPYVPVVDTQDRLVRAGIEALVVVPGRKRVRPVVDVALQNVVHVRLDVVEVPDDLPRIASDRGGGDVRAEGRAANAAVESAVCPVVVEESPGDGCAVVVDPHPEV